MDDESATRTALGKFAPGVSGNPAGRPKKGRAITDVLIRKLDEVHPAEADRAKDEGRPPRTNIEIICDRLLHRVLQGDLVAIGMVMNRVEGKPPSSIEIDHSGTVKHEHGQSSAAQLIISKLDALRERKQKALPPPIDAEVIEA